MIRSNLAEAAPRSCGFCIESSGSAQRPKERNSPGDRPRGVLPKDSSLGGRPVLRGRTWPCNGSSPWSAEKLGLVSKAKRERRCGKRDGAPCPSPSKGYWEDAGGCGGSTKEAEGEGPEQGRTQNVARPSDFAGLDAKPTEKLIELPSRRRPGKLGDQC